MIADIRCSSGLLGGPEGPERALGEKKPGLSHSGRFAAFAQNDNVPEPAEKLIFRFSMKKLTLCGRSVQSKTTSKVFAQQARGSRDFFVT
jgi:hypothetical protein